MSPPDWLIIPNLQKSMTQKLSYQAVKQASAEIKDRYLLRNYWLVTIITHHESHRINQIFNPNTEDEDKQVRHHDTSSFFDFKTRHLACHHESHCHPHLGKQSRSDSHTA